MTIVPRKQLIQNVINYYNFKEKNEIVKSIPFS